MARLEWQAVTSVLHVVDTELAEANRAKRLAQGKRYGSGPRAICGRYPQRNNYPELSWPVDEPELKRMLAIFGLTKCPDCEDVLDEDTDR